MTIITFARVMAVSALAATLCACAAQGPLSEQDQENRRLLAVMLLTHPQSAPPPPWMASRPQIRCSSIANGNVINTTCQ